MFQRLSRPARYAIPILCLLLLAGYCSVEFTGKKAVEPLPPYQTSPQKAQEPLAYQGNRMPQAQRGEPLLHEERQPARAFAEALPPKEDWSRPRGQALRPPRPDFPEATEQGTEPDRTLLQAEENARDLREISQLLLELDQRLGHLEKEFRQSRGQEKDQGPRESARAADENAKSERKEKSAETDAHRAESKGENARSRASLLPSKQTADWEIVGFSGTRVAIRNSSGTHFLRIGQSLQGVTIRGIDVDRGRITTSEGVLTYR